MSDKNQPKTLGFHRQMAATVFGEGSAAVTFLDGKIKESPNGEDGVVVADEAQLIMVLANLHSAFEADSDE